MRRAMKVCSILIVSLTAACHSMPPVSPVAGPLHGETPSWIPAYTPEQQALLAPVDRPIQVPARRVFPDLARFRYANTHPMVNPEEGVKFTRMVATVLSDSPRFYSLDEAKPELANLIVQYGPAAPPEPDGWLIPKHGASGDDLATAPITDLAREAFEKGEKRAAARDLAGAVEQYRIAVAKSPQVPALRLALASALGNSGQASASESAFRDLVRADPTFAPAHVALAELAERRNDPQAARHEIAEALAYAPASKRAAEVAIRLGASPSRFQAPDKRPHHPIPIFLDV